MKNNVIKDYDDSTFDAIRLVYPKILKLGWFQGSIISIEEKSSDLANILDIEAGIDAINIDNGIIGLANRVRWKINWRCFTVRVERSNRIRTEFPKRLEALNSNGRLLYPYFAIQSYIDIKRTGKLLSIAIAQTRDIWDYINEGFDQRKKVPGGNEMSSIYWVEFEHKYPIYYWDIDKGEVKKGDLI